MATPFNESINALGAGYNSLFPKLLAWTGVIVLWGSGYRIVSGVINQEAVSFTVQEVFAETVKDFIEEPWKILIAVAFGWYLQNLTFGLGGMNEDNSVGYDGMSTEYADSYGEREVSLGDLIDQLESRQGAA